MAQRCDVIEGIFVGLPTATLQTMLTEWLACLSAIAVAHQSYSIGGRNFNRANLSEVTKTVAEIQHALDLRVGTLTQRTYADMSG